MNRTILAIVALAAAWASPAAAAERSYSVTDFDRIIVEGPYIVRVTSGRSTTARASGSNEALERLAMDVTGQTLRIRRDRTGERSGNAVQAGPVTIELTARTLRSARLIGPGTLDVDRAEGLRVELTVQGSGRLRATNIAADALSLGLLGSGRMEVAGTAETLRATVDGTGDLDGAGLRTESANIVTNTLGTVALAVSREANVSAMGLGNVAISGRPSCNVRGPGAGQVSCGSNQR
ncbi:MAG TPA: head GIN domain-containing protein [Allosphingosinicella sp.]|nr:head GIN domain-containing protein [Allosphingosinicella sp.]